MKSNSKQGFGSLYLVTALLLVSSINSISVADAHPNSRLQNWLAGWDIFDKQLDYNTSKVFWKHSPGGSRLVLTYILRGATPNRQYQVGVHLFDSCPSAFGQFPVGPCDLVTREGITRVVASIEFGVVTTDSKGNGSFSLSVNGIAAGTYEMEFNVRAGVGCNLGGCGACDVVFQSPGPFGVGTTKITFR